MDLSGKRIFIVEDDFLVALSLEDHLRALGGTVVGPAATLAEAIRMAQDVAADLAIVDIHLCGEPVFPAAAILRARGIPMIFASGLAGHAPLPPAFAGALQVPKPYTHAAIQGVIERLMPADARPAESLEPEAAGL